jgi:hypothetical protein
MAVGSKEPIIVVGQSAKNNTAATAADAAGMGRLNRRRTGGKGDVLAPGLELSALILWRWLTSSASAGHNF